MQDSVAYDGMMTTVGTGMIITSHVMVRGITNWGGGGCRGRLPPPHTKNWEEQKKIGKGKKGERKGKKGKRGKERKDKEEKREEKERKKEKKKEERERGREKRGKGE